MNSMTKFLMINLLGVFSVSTIVCMESVENPATYLVSPIEKAFDDVEVIIEPTIAEQQEIVVSRDQTKAKVKSLPIKACCCTNCCCMSAVVFVFKHMRCLCKCFTCMTCCCSNKCVDCLCKE